MNNKSLKKQTKNKNNKHYTKKEHKNHLKPNKINKSLKKINQRKKQSGGGFTMKTVLYSRLLNFTYYLVLFKNILYANFHQEISGKGVY